MPVTLRHLRDQVEELVKSALDVYDAGEIHMGEAIAVLPGLVRDTMELVGTLEGMSGEDRRELVVDAVRYGYKLLDPDIPFVPHWIESPVESAMLQYLVPPLVDTLFGLLPEKFRGE